MKMSLTSSSELGSVPKPELYPLQTFSDTWESRVTTAD